MTTNLQITVDQGKLAEVRSDLDGIDKGLEQVATLAVNKTTRSARVRIEDAITEELTLTKPDLRKHDNVKMKLANYRDLRAEITIDSGRIGLSHFAPEWNKNMPGATYHIRRSGGRKQLLHGFLQTMESTHEGIFLRGRDKRIMTRGTYKGKLREPIIERFGPSIPEAAEKIEALSEQILDETIGSDLERNLDQQVVLLIKRRGGEVPNG